MRTHLGPIVFAFFAAAFVAGCHAPAGAPRAARQTAPMAQGVFVSAKDPRFTYAGRVDESLSAGVGLIWQATRAEIDFDGDQVALAFSDAQNANFYNVQVDDRVAVFEVKPGREEQIAFSEPLARGRHHLTLFKRTEASAGWATFDGIRLAPGAHVWKAAAPVGKQKYIFFGDSITAGACDEDGPQDQWESRRTHNAAGSYASFVARDMNADYENIAVSGMGIITGFVDVTAGQIWDRVYPTANSPRADLTLWKPDVVFINWGENDTNFTARYGKPFPPDFADGYVAVVRAIREAYPSAEIVLLRGGMAGCAQNMNLRAAWETAVGRLESSDPKITHFVFQHFSAQHPRVAEHRILADELVAWLRTQRFASR